ncbi:MAG: heavy metal sensor histidine kinase [Advenella sp.]
MPGKRRSLAIWATLSFAVISCLIVSSLGFYLYSSAKQALEVRADYTLIGRVERFRTLLHDLYNVRQMEERPAIFESMLGNEKDVRIFQRENGTPFIVVNPDRMTPPPMIPVPVGQRLTINALRAGERADGIRVRWVSALADIGDQGGTVRITAAYVMTQEAGLLHDYLLRVIGAIVLAVLLTTLLSYLLLKRGLRSLTRMSQLAAQITPSQLTLRFPDTGVPSELHQLAIAFNAMLERLQGGFEHLSQFSADLAHELRTPVNILMGQTQVALGRVRTKEEYEQLLESNLEELERIAHIIENILFLSRADHATIAIERAPLDLATELHKIAEYFEGPALERGMPLHVNAGGCVVANTVMWRRAVNNLVINAIRYGRPGMPILLSAHADPSGCTVTIENTSEPVSQVQAERMFDRFYRGDQSRNEYTESNGLGLALVKAIMALHGGSATVLAMPDGQIRFALQFPADPTSSQT